MVKVKDTAQFINRAREVHGDRYDYSQSVWAGADKPIIIGCKVCGPITLAWASSHYLAHKCGCSVCNHKLAMDRKKKHDPPKKCIKCGKLTKKQGEVCARCCAKSNKCFCGNFRLNRHTNLCKQCDGWGKVLRSRLSTIANRMRRDHRLSEDRWLKWAATKQAILQFRSRLNVMDSALKATCTHDWNMWSAKQKNKLRSEETLWQKKYRMWQQGLSRRSQVEPTSLN
jgi:hypothetical protein